MLYMKSSRRYVKYIIIIKLDVIFIFMVVVKLFWVNKYFELKRDKYFNNLYNF